MIDCNQTITKQKKKKKMDENMDLSDFGGGVSEVQPLFKNAVWHEQLQERWLLAMLRPLPVLLLHLFLLGGFILASVNSNGCIVLCAEQVAFS